MTLEEISNEINKDPVIIYILVDKDGIFFNVHYTRVKANWLQTKDLHPRNKDLQKIRNFIYNANDLKYSYKYAFGSSENNYKYLEILIVEYEDDLKQILKVKNDKELFKILITNYINSNKGFEFFLPYILNKLNDKLFSNTKY